MKKIAAISLAVIFLFAVNSTVFAATKTAAFQNKVTVLAAADTVSQVPYQTEIDVTAKYEGTVQTPDVYSVNIEWGAMEFVYTEKGVNVWNPDTHEYQLSVQKGWTASGNTVTVTNHSNQPVTATLLFQADAGYESVKASLDKTVMKLDTAVGTSVKEAPADTAVLTVDGTLDSSVREFTTVGRITVSLR